MELFQNILEQVNKNIYTVNFYDSNKELIETKELNLSEINFYLLKNPNTLIELTDKI